MWGLGCLIWEVFNGPLPKTSALKTFGKVRLHLNFRSMEFSIKLHTIVRMVHCILRGHRL